MSTVTISLPTQIAKRVDVEKKKLGFATRSEFIRNLLRKYFTESTEKTLAFHEFKPRPLEEIRTAFEKTGKYNKKFVDSLIEGLSQSSAYANKPSE